MNQKDSVLEKFSASESDAEKFIHTIWGKVYLEAGSFMDYGTIFNRPVGEPLNKIPAALVDDEAWFVRACRHLFDWGLNGLGEKHQDHDPDNPVTNVKLLKDIRKEEYISKRLHEISNFANDKDPVTELHNWSGKYPLFVCSRPMNEISNKAYGIFLAENLFYFLNNLSCVKQGVVFISFDKITEDNANDIAFAYKQRVSGSHYFLRACPKIPRHGIIDSVGTNPVTFGKDLLNLKRKMVENGEDTGVVIVPFFKSDFSAVSSRLITTYGLGHDGVTSGGEFSITINHGFEHNDSNLEKIVSVMDEQKNIEVETIYKFDKKSPVVVQLRNAIGHNTYISSIPDSFPGFTKTNKLMGRDYNIFHVSGTDLESVEQIPDSGNVLLVHHNGSILSHAAAWARQKNWSFIAVPNGTQIPQNMYINEAAPCCVVFSDKILSKTKTVKSVEFKKEFFNTFDCCMADNRWDSSALKLMGYAAFAFSHFSSEKTVTRETAEIAAVFCSAVIRMTVLSCVGEIRHFIGHSDSVNDATRKAIVKIVTGKGMPYSWSSVSRNEIYEHLMERIYYPYNKTITGMEAVESCFSDYPWHGSYGGKKWAKIAEMAVEILKFAKKKNFSAFINKFNLMLNLVHNTGWYLNKFLEENTLDTAYQYPLHHRQLYAGFDALRRARQYSNPQKPKYARHVFTMPNKLYGFVKRASFLGYDDLKEELALLPKGVLAAAGTTKQSIKNGNFDPFVIKTYSSSDDEENSETSDVHEMPKDTLVMVSHGNEEVLETHINHFKKTFSEVLSGNLMSYSPPAAPPKGKSIKHLIKAIITPDEKGGTEDQQDKSTHEFSKFMQLKMGYVNELDHFIGSELYPDGSQHMHLNYSFENKVRAVWYNLIYKSGYHVDDICFNPCESCGEYHSTYLNPEWVAPDIGEFTGQIEESFKSSFKDHLFSLNNSCSTIELCLLALKSNKKFKHLMNQDIFAGVFRKCIASLLMSPTFTIGSNYATWITHLKYDQVICGMHLNEEAE